MPRAKRPLADANVNAPPAKKTRGGKDAAPEVVDLTTTASPPAKQSAGGSKKTTKKNSKQPAQDENEEERSDNDSEGNTNDDSADGPGDTNSTASKPKKNTQPRWIPMCAPDISTDYVEDEDEDSFEDTHTCDVCKDTKAFMEKNPKWPWVTTKSGMDLANKWLQQMDNRTPDLHSVYFYNDYAPYGCAEVIENVVLACSTEVDRTKIKPMPLWHNLEGMALFFDRGTDYIGMHSEGDQVERLLEVVGAVILSALKRLIEADRLDEKTKVHNITPVFAQLISWGKQFVDYETTTRWTNCMVYVLNNLAKSAVDFSLIKKSDAWIREAEAWWDEEIGEDEGVDRDEDGKMTKDSILATSMWKEWDHEEKIDLYASDYGNRMAGLFGQKPIGGFNYDITKIPKKELDAQRRKEDRLCNGDFGPYSDSE